VYTLSKPKWPYLFLYGVHHRAGSEHKRQIPFCTTPNGKTCSRSSPFELQPLMRCLVCKTIQELVWNEAPFMHIGWILGIHDTAVLLCRSAAVLHCLLTQTPQTCCLGIPFLLQIKASNMERVSISILYASSTKTQLHIIYLVILTTDVHLHPLSASSMSSPWLLFCLSLIFL